MSILALVQILADVIQKAQANSAVYTSSAAATSAATYGKSSPYTRPKQFLPCNLIMKGKNSLERPLVGERPFLYVLYV